MVEKNGDSNHHIWDRMGSLVHFRYSRLIPETLKDFLKIYTLRNFWIAVGAGALVFTLLLYLCLAISLPNPIRAIMMWLLIIIPVILKAHYNPNGIH